jgi:hypothetical protein
MQNPSTTVTATIAIVAALVGGLVTGLFTWLAMWREHLHDRKTYLERRSHDAASNILEQLTNYDRAIANTLLKPTLDVEVIDAGNDFAERLALRSIAVQDAELRLRLQRHMQLSSAVFGRIGGKGAPLDAAKLKELVALQHHFILVSRTIAAHVNGEMPLPNYPHFDVTSRAELLAWAASAELHP